LAEGINKQVNKIRYVIEQVIANFRPGGSYTPTTAGRWKTANANVAVGEQYVGIPLGQRDGQASGTGADVEHRPRRRRSISSSAASGGPHQRATCGGSAQPQVVRSSSAAPDACSVSSYRPIARPLRRSRRCLVQAREDNVYGHGRDVMSTARQSAGREPYAARYRLRWSLSRTVAARSSLRRTFCSISRQLNLITNAAITARAAKIRYGSTAGCSGARTQARIPQDRQLPGGVLPIPCGAVFPSRRHRCHSFTAVLNAAKAAGLS
jgi:hypothetical protein